MLSCFFLLPCVDKGIIESWNQILLYGGLIQVVNKLSTGSILKFPVTFLNPLIIQKEIKVADIFTLKFPLSLHRDISEDWYSVKF